MTPKPKALMTAYVEGSIISRELRDMLNDEAADVRFERELAELDAQCGNEYGGMTDGKIWHRREWGCFET